MLSWLNAWLPNEALLQVLREDLEAGLEVAAIVVANPFQRWAAGRALVDLVTAYPDQLFPALDHLLRHPLPYQAVSAAPDELARANDAHFSTRLLLAEMAGLSYVSGLSDRLARILTAPLQRVAPKPLQSLLKIYYAWLIADEPALEDLLALLSASLEALAIYMWNELGRSPEELGGCATQVHNQHARLWIEVCEGFRTWKCFLECQSAEDLSQAAEQITWADECSNPLRPDVLAVLGELAQLGSQVGRESSPETVEGAGGGTKDFGEAELSLKSGLARIAAQAEQLPPPESTLAAATARHWSDIITAHSAHF